MPNNLSTKFIFDDVEGNKLDALRGKLIDFNDFVNKIGKDVDFGKNLNDEFVEAGKGADTFKEKVKDLTSPTFGGAYVEESKKINKAWDDGTFAAQKYQSAAEKALTSTKGLADAGANSLREINKFNNESKGIFEIPTSKNSLYEEIEKSRLSVKKLNSEKLDGKNFDGLRQAGNRIESELAAIQKKIVDTERLLKNTKDKTVISKLNEDLATADDRYSRLLGRVREYENARKPSVPVGNPVTELSDSSTETTLSGRRGRITETQRALLEIADDFVPAGFNRPFNAVAKEVLAAANAKAALTAATTASTAAEVASTAATTAATAATTAQGTAAAATTVAVEAETAAFTGLSFASLGIFAGFAAAGFAVVKVTQNIRAEAEHNLEVQNRITAELNKQRVAAKESQQSFAEQRANAIRGDVFSRSVASENIEQLTRRKNALEQSREQTRILQDATAFTSGIKSDKYEVLSNNLANEERELLDVESRLRAQKSKAYDNAFQQTNYNDSKSREDRLASEKRYADKVAEYNKKRLEDSEKVQAKVKELGKVYSDTFDNLFQKRNSDNPFFNIFNETDKAAKELEKTLRGLDPALVAIAEQMQRKLNADSLFNARLDNDFAAFDLREQSKSLRDFKSPKIDDTDKFFKDFTENAIKQAIAANGGSSIRYNSNIFENGKNPDGSPKFFTSGFTRSDIRDETTTVFERTGGFQESRGGKGFGNNLGGFFRREKTFADLTEQEKNDFLNKDDLPLREKLSRSFDLATNRRAFNDEQQSSIDRKLISLAQGVDPSKLTDRERDLAASALERQAERIERNESKAREQRQQQIDLQTRIAASNEALLAKGLKEGSKALEITLKDETGGVTYDYLPERPQ